MLARLAAHDAPIAFLPLDFLCVLLHQALRAFVPSDPPAAHRHVDVVHLRMARLGRGRGASLIRMEITKTYDAQGRVVTVFPTFRQLP